MILNWDDWVKFCSLKLERKSSFTDKILYTGTWLQLLRLQPRLSFVLEIKKMSARQSLIRSAYAYLPKFVLSDCWSSAVAALACTLSTLWRQKIGRARASFLNISSFCLLFPYYISEINIVPFFKLLNIIALFISLFSFLSLSMWIFLSLSLSFCLCMFFGFSHFLFGHYSFISTSYSFF